MAQKALREVGEASTGVGPIVLCGRSNPAEQVRAALLETRLSNSSAVESYAIRRLRPDDREQLQRASVVVYGGEVTHRLDDETRADLEVVGSAGRPLLVVLEGVELPMDASVEAARVRGDRARERAGDQARPVPRRSACCTRSRRRRAPPAPTLAARLPALRPAVVEAVIETASRRNAVIAAAVWIPGADLPAPDRGRDADGAPDRRVLRRRGRAGPGRRAPDAARRRLRPARCRARAARRGADRRLGGEGRRRLHRARARSAARRSSTSSAAPPPASPTCARRPRSCAAESLRGLSP